MDEGNIRLSVALSKERSEKEIKKSLRKLGIADMTFQLEHNTYGRMAFAGARAETYITSPKKFTVVLSPEVCSDSDVRMGLFSIHHEACHVKLYRMGYPITGSFFEDKKRWPDYRIYNLLCIARAQSRIQTITFHTLLNHQSITEICFNS